MKEEAGRKKQGERSRENLPYYGYIILITLCVIGAFGIITYASLAPRDFPVGTIVSVEKNMTLTQVADLLAERGIIRLPSIYKAFVVLLGASRKVAAGDYLFSRAESALGVAYRTVKGIQGLPQIKITIPEGIASPDIARLLAKNIEGFDSRYFLTLAKPLEGHLFPDTYFFYENVKPEEVVDALQTNFDRQMKKVRFSAKLSGRSFDDVLKLASIVEKEATSTIDRKIIAGILWRRLAANMPLQVDPPFFYILGKNSLDLTRDDLAIDSPYNLYKHTGLPPTPIDNPGLGAIGDTINPTTTKYWFYLSDSKGNMHYAETHDGHLANKDKYLQ